MHKRALPVLCCSALAMRMQLSLPDIPACPTCQQHS